MEVLISSKTHFGNNVCVGGIVLDNNHYLRLLNPGGWYQYADTDFNIGDVWDIKFNPSSPLREPHNEDVIILSKRFIRSIGNFTEFILDRNIPISRGSITGIFESKLRWANSGSGYLSVNFPDYPSHSVGFWISDKPLTYENEHYLYPIPNSGFRKLKYKGLPTAINTIPTGTLLRVSLAKWWKPENSEIEERCYAQLSGWY